MALQSNYPFTALHIHYSPPLFDSQISSKSFSFNGSDKQSTPVSNLLAQRIRPDSYALTFILQVNGQECLLMIQNPINLAHIIM